MISGSGIDVARKPGLSPSDQSEPTDDAESKLFLFEEGLKGERSGKKGVHYRSRENQACCSTRPEVVRLGIPPSAGIPEKIRRTAS